MALIGPKPTVGSVSSLVRSTNGIELSEIFDEVLQFTDGPILTNLAANGTTRPKLVEYLTPQRLKEHFDQLEHTSDPNFVALSWLADEVDELRAPILDLVSSQRPMSKSSLTIFTRLLTKEKLDVKKDISDDILKQALIWLQHTSDEKHNTHWQVLAALFLRAAGPLHEKAIVSFVDENLKDGSDNLNAAFAVIRTTHDMFPGVVDKVWSLSEPKPSDDLFSMLSVLSNTKETRDKVKNKFGEIVEKAADDGSVLASIVDAKILAGTTSQTGDIKAAAKRLDHLSESVFEKNVNEVSLEGLACTAMLVTVRDRLAAQPAKTSVIAQLVALIKEKPSTVAYAVLAILAQLARFPIKPTSEEQQKSKLRIQSLGKSVFDEEEDLNVDNEEVKSQARFQSAKICDQVLATSLLSWITINATKLSLSADEQLAYLLRELTSHQDRLRREKLAQQGAAVIAMYLWALDKPQRLSPRIRSVAAATISKVLATIVPQVALTANVARPVVVPPLCEQIHNEHSERPNLDTFEALRALTNLSSLEDSRLRAVISKHVWPKMFAALNSEFLQIRRSSLELICNLMSAPSSAEHFVQNTDTSKALLSLLGRSLLVDDEDSRLAAAGALAILSEWETAPEYIGHNSECIEGMTGVLGKYPDDDAILLRVLSALNTIIKVTSAELDDEVVEQIVFNQGLTHLEELVDTLDPSEHGEVAQLVLQCIKLIAEYKIKNTGA